MAWALRIVIIVLATLSYGAGELRLVPGPRNGRLEVKRYGVWGTVCDDSFDIKDAEVACRELGFSSRYSLPWTARPGSGRILMDDLKCSGIETSLSKCRYNSDHNCNHNEDVGVFCSDTVPVTIRPSVPVISIMDNETEELTCVLVQGYRGDKSYSWTQAGRQISTSQKIQVSGSGSKNGEMTCTVTDGSGNVIEKASTIIDILRPPSLLASGDKYIIEGRNESICLNIAGNPLPDTYVWKKAGSRWQNGSTCPVLDPVERSDAGDYVIKVKNTMTDIKGTSRIGTGIQVVSVKVLYPPIVTCPSEVTVDLNATAVLHCTVDASPDVEVLKWSINASADQGLSIVLGPDYHMESAQLSDSGLYMCEATNMMKDSSGRSTRGESQCWTKLVVTDTRLPPVSMVSDDSISFSSIWASYKFYIIGAAGGVAALLVIGVVLVVYITRKRQSQRANINGQKSHSKSPPPPCTKDYPVGNTAHMANGETWEAGDSAGNVCTDVRSENCNQDDVMYDDADFAAGNVYTEDPTSMQHYGNVCFDQDVYENVDGEKNDDQLYQNTMFH